MVTHEGEVKVIGGVETTNLTWFFLADDDKPTEGVGNGSRGVEIDTGKEYYFDAENATWYEKGASQDG